MDPMRTYLGKILLEEITPVVMVLTTPLAEEACRKNGLSFVSTLAPFSLFRKIDVPVRTASDQSYRLQMFKIRVVYASDIRKPNYEGVNEHLKKVVSDSNKEFLPQLLLDPPDLASIINKSESDLSPQWVRTFNKELMHTVSYSEHEAFDHPVACVLVVSSRDEQPINKFVDLFNTNQLPFLLNDGIMDPKILRHYLLLHDNQDGTAEKATSILSEMRGTFGSNDCKLLCINSSTEAQTIIANNIWLPYKTYGTDDQNVACYFTMDDLNEIRDFMQDLASNQVIPYMEQKIRVLNQQVSATRKGFRNQIRNLWWRKGKEDMPESVGGLMYTFNSIESQIRVLADYAFMLRDYELALSNYRLLSTDYKLDKAWIRFAGVQEMSGLCYFMMDQSRKESEACMETALDTYLKLGPAGHRNATRCGLWFADMLKSRGLYREASSVYFRISSVEPTLHCAVILEQASCCYMLCRPPLLSKYALHLILAGNSYFSSDQKEHAIRVYRNALSVYKETPWKYLNDHVHHNIGRWYGILGLFDVAIKHLLEVVSCSHQSAATQHSFLKDLFNFVQSTGKKFYVYNLGLPKFNMSTLKVIYEYQHTYASVADVGTSETIWLNLEEEMIPSSSAVRTNWLDSQPESSPLLKYGDACICVAGEPVRVELELKNPLQISVSVAGIALICELSMDSSTSNTEPGAVTVDAGETITTKNPFYQCEGGTNGCYFSLSNLDVVLGGGETKRVQLEVTPKIEGILKLLGIRWTLSESVTGYQYFESSDNKRNKKGRMPTKKISRNSLIFAVIKGLPKLVGHVDHLPTRAFSGDLRHLKLELRNQSEYSVKNLKLKVSHPRFLTPGKAQDDLQFPQCIEKYSQSESNLLASPSGCTKSSLFLFPQDITIQGGADVSWPLWFHSATSGKFSLYISVYYEMDNQSNGITYRTLRMHYPLEVLPSLDISFVITPCLTTVQEYLVRMDIINRTKSDSFTLHQLSSVGSKCMLSTLPSFNSICSSEHILANQAVSFFFKLKEVSTTNEYGDQTSDVSDIAMGSESSSGLLFDVCKSPLSDFHCQERYHQGKLIKETRRPLDFILISKLAGSNSISEQGSEFQLYSHHACYSSVLCKSPVWWLMNGPRTVVHDFTSSYCEVNIHVVIRNCSKHAVSVRLVTADDVLVRSTSASSPRSADLANQAGGWHDVSLENDVSSIQETSTMKSTTAESSPSFIWCASSSTKVSLHSSASAAVPLKVCIFSPGTYNLSSYELHWKVLRSETEQDDSVQNSGGARGHSFYVTVLQATS